MKFQKMLSRVWLWLKHGRIPENTLQSHKKIDTGLSQPDAGFPTQNSDDFVAESLPEGAKLVFVTGIHTGAGTSSKVAELQLTYPDVTVVDGGILALPVNQHLPAGFARRAGFKRVHDAALLGEMISSQDSRSETPKSENSHISRSEATYSKLESAQGNNSELKSSEADYSGPESSEPESSGPENSEPENSEPENSEPEHSGLGNAKLQTSEPNVPNFVEVGDNEIGIQPDLIILMIHPADTAGTIKPYMQQLTDYFAATKPQIWLRHKPVAPFPIGKEAAVEEMILRLATYCFADSDAGVQRLHQWLKSKEI